MDKLAKLLFTFILFAIIQSCVSVEAYQKMYVYDRDMDLEDPAIQSLESNFQSYREGAAGANGGKTGGGCGCNWLPYFVYIFNTQSTDTQNANDPVSEDQSATVDVNFLFGYYDQDGNHSAVTGGIGTEELTDHDFRFLINIPLDSVRWLNIDAGFNYYSSASTDNIDTKVSSASSEDLRSKFYFTYTKFQPKSRSSYSLGWGGSVESDYISTSISAAWNSTSKDGNGQLNIGVRAFFDNWVLIIPEELRKPETELPRTDSKQLILFQVPLLFSK